MKNVLNLRLIVILTLFNACSTEQFGEGGITDYTEYSKISMNIDFSPSTKKAVNIINSVIKRNTSFGKTVSQLSGKIDTKIEYGTPVSFFSNEMETIVYSVKSNAENSFEDYAITFIYDGVGVRENLIIKTVDVEENVKIAEYYSFEGQLLWTTMFDNNQGKPIVQFEDIEIIKSISSSSKMYKCEDGWGERTQDCLEDVYSNHGWLSVWATVQSAFIPQTAAALAGACAYDALTEGGCESDYYTIDQ